MILQNGGRTMRNPNNIEEQQIVVGGGVTPAVGAADGCPTPSFLVPNMNNVKRQLYQAERLKTLWDFLLLKGTTERTKIIVMEKMTLR